MQELSLEAQIALHAVLRIAGDRKVDRGEVDADLVGAPGLEPDIEERVRGEQLAYLEVRYGLPRLVGVERASGRIAAIAADRRIDAAARGARPSAHEREVAALDLAPANRLLQRGVGVLGPRDDQQPGGVAIEPMHDPRTLRIRASGGAQRQKLAGESSRPLPRSGMHDETGGLVDDDEVLVLVREPDGDGLGDQLSGDARLVRQIDLDDGRLPPGGGSSASARRRP